MTIVISQIIYALLSSNIFLKKICFMKSRQLALTYKNPFKWVNFNVTQNHKIAHIQYAIYCLF